MKIKEVEILTGIRKANIRYYEEKGLLQPVRCESNKYREYSEEDVRRLQQIKTLRMLDIPIADMSLLFEDKLDMQEVLERRIQVIEKEEKELSKIKTTCQIIIDRKIDLDSVNEEIFAEEPQLWKEKLQQVLVRDIVEEIIDRNQFNKTVFLMLIWGYFISMIITILMIVHERSSGTLLVGNLSSNADMNFLFIIGILTIIAIMTIHFTANVKVHIVAFHIGAVTLAPFLISMVRLGSSYVDEFTRTQEEWDIIMQSINNGTYGGQVWIDPLENVSIQQFISFWLIIMLYVLALYIASKFWTVVFSKTRYLLFFTIGFIVMCMIALGITCKYWEMASSLIAYITLLIGINWSLSLADRQTYNRYYAVCQAGEIMNFIGMHVSKLRRSQKFMK